jgi:hypothetical protein
MDKKTNNDPQNTINHYLFVNSFKFSWLYFNY